MTRLRPAAAADVPAVMDIIAQAKAFLRAQGIDQWQTGYPESADILGDIERKRGFCIDLCGEIVGYLCLDFAGEPTYDAIEGAWLSDQPYGVIHRCTIAERHRGKGLSKAMFNLCAEECLRRGVGSLRIDTHPDNRIMQHTLPLCGFAYCGVIYWEGEGKLAYERLLG